MANQLLRTRFRAGPRTLIVGTAISIALGTGGMYFYSGNRANLLYFFYLPVAAVSVVLGRKIGLFMALFAALVAVALSAVRGLSYIFPESALAGEKIATLVMWVVFLLAVAWLVGLVSERGGSLSLTRGLGVKAIRAIERERRRTGQDIHDGIAQYAAAALMETEILASAAVEQAPQVLTQVERIREPLGLLVEEARTMVGRLRPPTLGASEFASSFSQLGHGFYSRTGVPCQIEMEGDFTAHSDSMRICVYRIVQEALSNVEQHAEATMVRVWARASKGGVDLIIRDNGKGFRPSKRRNGGGNGQFGLRGMEERAGYLGGRLTIRSAPGDGTSVVAHIPSYRGEGNGHVRTTRSN